MSMKTLGIGIATVALTAAIAIAAAQDPAFAGSDDSRVQPALGDGPTIAIGEVVGRLKDAGYTEVSKVERDDSGYEAKARDKDGQVMEVYVDGTSGEITREKSSD